MFSDAIGKIRPEILECDQDTIRAAIERVLAKKRRNKDMKIKNNCNQEEVLFCLENS